MSSDMKFVGVIVMVAVLAVVGFVIFGRKATLNDPAAHVDPSTTLEDAGQLVRDDSYTKGTAGASVVVVEFGDYQCPACKAAEPELAAIVNEYGDRVQFVFRHFPLPNHRFAQLTANAVESAGAQGKYWEMHNIIFEKQDDWSNVTTSRAIDLMAEYAEELELDGDQVRTAVTERQFKDKIARDLADALALDVSKTPTFFINGAQVELAGLRQAIDNALNSSGQ